MCIITNLRNSFEKLDSNNQYKSINQSISWQFKVNRVIMREAIAQINTIRIQQRITKDMKKVIYHVLYMRIICPIKNIFDQ